MLALISLSEAKEYLGITDTGDDLVLTHLLNEVSAIIQKYIGRELVSQERTQYYSGDGSCELILKDFPIISINSINVDSQRSFDSSTEIDSENFIVKKGSGIVEAFNLLGNWTPGRSNIKIVYTSGYTVGNSGSDGTMPYDIRLAAKRLLDLHFRTGYTHRKLDYQSESISGMNVTFKEGELPKDVKSILDAYRSLTTTPQFEYEESSTATASLVSSDGTFVNSDLVNGILTLTHNRNLSAPYAVQVVIFDNTGTQIIPDSVVGSANSFQVNLTSFIPLSGTWGYIYAT